MQVDNFPPANNQLPVEPSPPRPRIWGAWSTIGFGAAIFAVYFVTQSIIAVAFAVANLVSTPAEGLNQTVAKLATNGLLVSVATVASAITGLAFILLFIRARKGASIAAYLGLKIFGRRTVFTLLAVVAGLIILSFLLDKLASSPRDTSFTVDAYQTSRWPVLFGFAVVVFAPLFEECFFRGFVFVGLAGSKIGAPGAIILTALTWALLHVQYDIYGMGSILVLGIVFGIVRHRTGSLWSTLLLHALWNLAALISTITYVRTGG